MASRVQHQTAGSAIDKPLMNLQWNDFMGTRPLSGAVRSVKEEE
jgi:hypothetical protein